MKKTNKIVLLFIITILLLTSFNIVFSAINPNDYDPSDSPITVDEAKPLIDMVGVILGTVRNISIIVAVISLMIMGFKFIMGSVEEKAKYKESMIPYVIGCVLAAGGTTIVSYIYNAVN